jgi:hypothetical protein
MLPVFLGNSSKIELISFCKTLEKNIKSTRRNGIAFELPDPESGSGAFHFKFTTVANRKCRMHETTGANFKALSRSAKIGLSMWYVKGVATDLNFQSIWHDMDLAIVYRC